MRGAEAVLKPAVVVGKKCLKKNRIKKVYRIRELDEKLRRERTKREARLLHRAKLAGVTCPTVYEVDEFSLTIDFINGKKPEMNAARAKQAGEILAKLHAADIIHGDFTPANLLVKGGKMWVIDFGLGFFSDDIEDKAVDVLTMLKSIEQQQAFIAGYKKYREAAGILDRVEEIKKRARYF